MSVIVLVGRRILGGFFLYSGINHFIGFRGMTQYANVKGVPFPAVAQGVTGLMLLFGGLSIVFGIYPFVGIVLLVAFLLPVTLMMHDFWKLDDTPLRMADRVNVMKTMALLGSVLMFLAIPVPWPLSLMP